MGPEPGQWRALSLAGLVVLLSLMTWFSATAILPELTAHYALSRSESVWLTNAVQLGFAIGAIGSSLFALGDIWPLTRFIAGACLVASLANVSLLVASSPVELIAARLVTGTALAGVYPPAMKLIATWFRRGRGLAMGCMVGALTLGSAMPHLIRALGGAVDWRAVLAFCSLGSLAAAAIAGFVLREGPYPFARAVLNVRQLGAIIRDRPVMLANAGYFGHMWELYAMWGWIFSFIRGAGAREIHSTHASALTFAVIAAGAPGCLVGGWLGDRIGRCFTTALMMAVSATASVMVCVTFDGPAWLFTIFALTWGFSVVADSAQFSAAVTELSETHLVGSALAFQMGVGFAITMLVIWLTPFVAASLGSWHWAFLILVPGPLFGMVAMLRLRAAPAAIRMAHGQR